MATSNKRDVRLGVEIETAGEENLKRLAAEVRSLAKAGDEAAPQYTELANALERNADVARELSAFRAASQAIEQTTAAAQQATEAAQRLRREYEQQAEATQALESNQKRVAAALDATKRQLLAATEQASIAKNALKGADDATGALGAAATAAADRVAALKKDVGNLGLDLKQAKAEATDASTALERLATQSLRADDAARSAASALRAQADTLERARAAATQLGADFSDVAAAQERLDVALRDGAGAVQAAAAAQKLAAEQRATQAAVDALTDDLDKQAAAVQGRLVPALLAASEAYEKEQAAIRESLALADREAADAAKRAALQQRLTQLREEDIAILRGETAERQRAQAVAESEQAAIRESEQFLATYNQRKAQAAAEALRFVEALEQEAAAADKANRRMAELNAQAERTKQADEYVRALAAAFDAVDQQAAQAAANTARLVAESERVSGAFSRLNIRSLSEIQTEINQTAAALRLLESRFAAGTITAYDLQRATGAASLQMQRLQAELRELPAAIGSLEKMNAAVLDLATRFGALGAAAATIGFVVKPVVDANLALDSMSRVLTTVYGSAQAAAEQIDFVRRVSEGAGLNVITAGEAFAKFAASAKQSGIDTALVQQAFKATAEAAGNLGLSSEKTTSILNALGQMANKGTVSMEELRQQLGDALPGALSLLAKGLGLTEPQLVKLVESGKLLTSEALGPLAEAMTQLAAPGGRVEGLRAAMERLANQFRLAYQSISDTSFYRGLVTVIDGVASNFGAATTAVKLFAEALLVSKIATAISNFIGLKSATAGSAAATAAHTAAVVENTAASGLNTAATGANTVAKEANAVASTAAAVAAGKNAAAWAGLAEGLGQVGPKLTAVTAQTGEAAARQGLLGRAVGTVTGLLGGKAAALVTLGIVLLEFRDKLATAAAGLLGYKDRTEEVLAAMKAAEKATKDGAAAREREGDSLVKLKVKYAEQAATLGHATAESEKAAKAAKALGEASVLAAELAGDEEAKLRATIRARQDEATALEALAARKREEVKLTEGLIVATEKYLEGRGELSKRDKEELDLLITKRDVLGGLTKAEQERLAALLKAQDAAEQSVASTKEQLRLDKERLEGQRAAAAEAEAEAKRELARVEQARQAAAVYGTNRKSVEEYRQAVEDARASAEAWRQQERLGLATKEQVNRADLRLAQAVGQYRDAVEDATKAVQRRLAAERERFGLEQQLQGVDRLRIETDLRIADLTGQYVNKLNAQIKLKELDLSASKNSIAVSDATARALREEANLRESVLSVTDKNYEAKKREIDALRNSAKANEIASAAEKERLRAAEVELGILNGTLYQGAKGWGDYGEQVDLVTGKLLKSADAADKLGASLSKLRSTQYDAQKFALDDSGGRFTASDGTLDPLVAKQNQDTAQSKYNTAFEANRLALDKVANYNKYFLTTGVDVKTTAARKAALRQEAQAAFVALQQAQKELDAANAEANLADGRDARGNPSADVTYYKKQLEDAKARGDYQDAADAEADLKAVFNGQPLPAGTPQQAAPAASKTVNINLAGLGSTSINVASSADAERLTAMFRQIEAAMNRSGG